MGLEVLAVEIPGKDFQQEGTALTHSYRGGSLYHLVRLFLEDPGVQEGLVVRHEPTDKTKSEISFRNFQYFKGSLPLKQTDILLGLLLRIVFR